MAVREKRNRSKNTKYSDGILQSGLSVSNKWCTLLCVEDNKVYSAAVKGLESEDGLGLTDGDIKIGKSVIWNYRGLPYNAKILEILDSKPTPKRRKINDSDNEEDNGKEDTETGDLPPSPVPEVGNEVSLKDGDLNESTSGVETCSSSNSLERTMMADDDSLKAIEAFMAETLKEQKEIKHKLDKVLAIIKGKGSLEATEQPEYDSDEEKNYTTDNGVNLLRLKVANCEKYALALMDAIFTEEQLASSCYIATTKSKKPPLPADKIKLIEECIEKRYGAEVFKEKEAIIRKKCNQKCIDTHNKKMKVKKEKEDNKS